MNPADSAAARAPTAADTGFVDAEFADAYPPGIENHYWNSARNQIVHRLLLRMMGRETGNVIEIGCGTGIVTDYLRRQRIECLGCDIGSAPACSAEVAPFLRLGADAFELPAGTRDATRFLLMLDVLEHIERPREFLAKCRAQFASLRGILFTVPARMEIWSNYDEYYRHFRRYDRRSIHEAYDPAHFSLAESGYFFHGLYPPALLLRLLNRPRATRLVAPTSPGPHRLLARLFNLEEKVIPRWVPGTSLYGVLRPVSSTSHTPSAPAPRPR